jgi:hypothetical protein
MRFSAGSWGEDASLPKENIGEGWREHGVVSNGIGD